MRVKRGSNGPRPGLLSPQQITARFARAAPLSRLCGSPLLQSASWHKSSCFPQDVTP